MKAYNRDVLKMLPDELESFVRDWAIAKTEYFRVEPFRGTADRGRDVVGFLTSELHEGEWDNYQCKQYGTTLPTGGVFHEIGKVLYYAGLKEFTPPRRYLFVAPMGINRNLQKVFFKPKAFKAAFIAGWDDHCRKTIIEGGDIPLVGDLLNLVSAYDFSCIAHVGVEELLADPAAKPVLYKYFGADPGPAPGGGPPGPVQQAEFPYIGQLVDAYSERRGVAFADHDEVASDPAFAPHLTRQRERFYDAEAFKRFYRDNTDPAVIETFENEIYHGVVEVCDEDHKDAYSRLNKVMVQAGSVMPSGVLAPHARVEAKQGVCHHLANEAQPRLIWHRP